MQGEKFYITTPIYFPSGNWHIGTCYSTVLADALARFERMRGRDVFFMTGTDEHGAKIQEKAEAAGVTPKAFVDGIVAELKELWRLFDISYDKYIRTTDCDHEAAVARIYERLYDKGDIYLGEYEGYYCVPCETHFTAGQLKDGKCPDCGREVETRREESYFFRLSKYEGRVRELLETDREFLQPESRRSEMIGFLNEGLTDLSVTRTRDKLAWGIPVPFDTKHVAYVWFDALTNYITGLGYTSDDEARFKRYWPADLHVMAKEITRFHSIIWPAILMALDLPLPKRVYAHGWLNFGGEKMSKSRGNTLNPATFADLHGVDATRYVLLKRGPIDKDTDYDYDDFVTTIDGDLANKYGNLVSRTVKLVENAFDGRIPKPEVAGEGDTELLALADGLYAKVAALMSEIKVPRALDEIMNVLDAANRYIDRTRIWELVKGAATMGRAATVLYNTLEVVRICSVALLPFMPSAPKRVFEKLGIKDPSLTGFESLKFGGLPVGLAVTKGEALFPRAVSKGAANTVGNNITTNTEEVNDMELITIDEFAKTKLVTAKVLAAEKVEGADKLLKLTVDAGEAAPRTVVSGIAKFYSAAELVGRQVVLVANLKPAKLRGITSEGMILCAATSDRLSIVDPGADYPAGTDVR